MSQVLLKKLKRKLPADYSKFFKAKQRPVSIRRFRAVFSGGVTDPAKVVEVITVAEEIIKEKRAFDKRILKVSGNKKSKKVNS